MPEMYVERVHTENVVLDIGEDVGALVIYTREEFRGKEIEVSPVGNESKRTHTAIHERQANGRTMFAGVYLELSAGDYIIWTNPTREITITGGQVAEVDLRDIVDAQALYLLYAGHPHSHVYGMSQHKSFSSPSLTDSLQQERNSGVWAKAPRDPALDILPPRYRNGKVVSAAPMGSAPMRYKDDGQVAWDEMWTGYCDLALAGGPPHRDILLEPVPPDEVRAALDDYERVVTEIERGFRLVTGLPTVRSEKAGWVGLKCEDEEMAIWLLRAIIVENVCVRREGSVLFLPAGPAFRLDQEIKNVVTVVAKTHHYWTEHLCS